MILRSTEFDLGQDKTRIKDPRDGARQHATVDALLARLFAEDGDRRWEIQVLADEVGMGKTFVALAVAYSLLSSMRSADTEADLRGCYQKVLVLIPNNVTLFNKWVKEVAEFVGRCVLPVHQAEVRSWFAPVPIDRIDELIMELRKRGGGRRVLVANMRVFSQGKLQHYDLKRRFLLGVLFRYWGTRFRNDQRERLLRGAPDDWPRSPHNLTYLAEHESERVPFNEDDLLGALGSLARSEDGADSLEKLLELCREIAEPFVRSRNERFQSVEGLLVKIYRQLMPLLIRQSLPLVIVDEAHHWKNGTNGFVEFANAIACRSRRALLLTATPFQLRPAEMLEILRVSDYLATCPTKQEAVGRQARLKRHRESVIRPVLDHSSRASRQFVHAWARLPRTVTREHLADAWNAVTLRATRRQLDVAVAREGAINADEVDHIVADAVGMTEPALRPFMQAALRLYAYNADLSRELGHMVIRQRRQTEHRLFRIGGAYASPVNETARRPDAHVLHGAPGLDVHGAGELPHYLLMRCVSEMKHGKGRSSLGSALTGCYSTLLHSAEGKAMHKRFTGDGGGSIYLELLKSMVDESQDEKHPKVREVANAVLDNWRAGEKSLIFCFRTNTAPRHR